ncbi:MAG: hypothetical protein PF569_08760 [Candidatus Woesearchaeota archaeon]|jgi:hypothetical protein|nr:hypothetical protein [Candidatus Woesearchaeota archaeon]
MERTIDKTFKNYYMDIDYTGKKTTTGDIYTYTDSDALQQAFRLWLTESKGEKLRKQVGGYLIPHLQKPMTPERIGDIKRSIKNGLSQEFKPRVQILSLEVTPIYNLKQWQIDALVYTPLLKDAVLVQERINNLV